MRYRSAIWILLLSSCATATREEGGDGVFLFPESAVTRMVGKGAENAPKEIRLALCDGRTPRYHPRWTVYIGRPTTTGMAIDTAAEVQAWWPKQASKWIAENFFFEAVTRGLLVPPVDYKPEMPSAPGSFPNISAAMYGTRTSIVIPDDQKLRRVRMLDLAVACKVYTFTHTVAGERVDYEQAVNARDWIWQDHLAASTRIKESPPQADGTILIEATLDMSDFCKNGVLASDLVAK